MKKYTMSTLKSKKMQQTFEERHAVPKGLYYKQFMQKGGLPHFAGRIHTRPQRGLGLSTGGNVFSSLIPLGLKLGKSVLPKTLIAGVGKRIVKKMAPKIVKSVISNTPTKIGKRVMKRVAPRLVNSAIDNMASVVTGQKKMKGALKDTLWQNRHLVGEAIDAAANPGLTGRKPKKTRPSGKRKPLKKKKRRRMYPRIWGGGLINTATPNKTRPRGQNKGSNYMYGDVFDRLR